MRIPRRIRHPSTQDAVLESPAIVTVKEINRFNHIKIYVPEVHLPLAYLPFHRWGQASALGARRGGIPVQQVIFILPHFRRNVKTVLHFVRVQHTIENASLARIEDTLHIQQTPPFACVSCTLFGLRRIFCDSKATCFSYFFLNDMLK